ncbi:MAG: xanthine dehydrogenase family protein molybdopterin-binding subunit [Thermoleophilia bacterium]
MSGQETQPVVGSSVPKRDGARFVTGRMTYTDDVVVPGMAHATVLRSTQAHARIRAISTVAAAAAPGVLAVLTGEDASRVAGPIPHWMSPEAGGGNHADVWCLARGKVLYVGQPVCAVVAETRADADAAASLIEVDYEPLPVVLDADDALRPDAPRLYDGWPDNVIERGRFEDGDVPAAFAGAAHVLEDEIRIQRYTSAPMEPRCYVADWDDRAGRLTVHGTFQNPHIVRGVLAGAMRVPENAVRVIAPTIGGGFGLKMHGHAEETLVCVLSRVVGRPVKWVESRKECFLISGREQRHRFRVAFDDDGVVSGLEVDVVGNVGALQALSSWGMVFVAALTFPAGYRIPNVRVDFAIVATNKGIWNGARGYGKEATNLCMERIMDLVAARLGLDPAVVRERNLIRRDEFPYRTIAGLLIDSGDYHAALRQTLDLLGYERWRDVQAAARREGRLLGVGIAYELTPEGADIPDTIVGGYDTSTVKMGPDGAVTVLTGVTSPGGGNDTGIAQIVAGELGIDPAAILVIQGDTDACPYGFGNYSGRSMLVGGGSAALAARDIADRLRRVAGAMLEADADDVELADGQARVRGDRSRSLPLRNVAYAVYTLAFATASMVEPPLESTKTYKPGNIDHTPDEKGRINPYPTYSNGAYAAVVEIDPETGKTMILDLAAVHDCGTVVNPALVEGQMQGGIAMGVGAALSEHQRYDAEGRPLNDRFKTYLLARAGDLPSIKLGHQVTPSPFTLLGTKGAGEASVGGSLAAVANAVSDALAPLGVTIRDFPLDPPRVLGAIRSASR